MKRTWKDAACEVAWLKLQRMIFCSQIEYDTLDVRRGIEPLKFLQNDKCAHFTCVNTALVFSEKTIFQDFRSAFMRWLDENEVK